MRKIRKVYTHPCKDGRTRVTVYYQDGSRRMLQQAKYRIEAALGRELTRYETVDHIDRNYRNDAVENLRVVDHIQHLRDDAKRVKLSEIICVMCGATALKPARYLRHNSKLGKSGPFCGRSCAGKYGAGIRAGTVAKLPIQPHVASIYCYNKKPG